MKLKLDENLGERGAALFRDAGHDVATVASQQLSSAGDRQLITACAAEGRCIVTLDLDFSNPLVFRPWEYAGIAVLRLPSKPNDMDLWIACRTLTGALARAEIIGKLWIVERGRIREYRPDRPEPEDH